MPTCLYLRGIPGSGKKSVGQLLARELDWPMVWVHLFDPVYKAIGEHRVSFLTDDLILSVSAYLMRYKRSFIVVRPSRFSDSVGGVAEMCEQDGYRFVPVQLTARYETLAARVASRPNESPFRITTKEALDEYLAAREAEEWPGETIIETDNMTPEQVAERIKGLL